MSSASGPWSSSGWAVVTAPKVAIPPICSGGVQFERAVGSPVPVVPIGIPHGREGLESGGWRLQTKARLNVHTRVGVWFLAGNREGIIVRHFERGSPTHMMRWTPSIFRPRLGFPLHLGIMAARLVENPVCIQIGQEMALYQCSGKLNGTCLDWTATLDPLPWLLFRGPNRSSREKTPR